MSKKTDAWMPLYVGDYLADTGHLSAAEHGAYLLLLMHYWRTALALPNDESKLRRICRMSEQEWELSRATLAQFFEINQESWYHGRVQKELDAARARSEQAREKAEARWSRQRHPNEDATGMPQHSNGTTEAMPEGCSSPSSSSSSSSSALPKKETPNGVSPASRLRAAAEPLPPDWKPGGDEIGLAESLGLKTSDIEREGSKFQFYYTRGKAAGRRTTPRGWKQAWANWIGKAAERLPDSPEVAGDHRAAYKPKEIAWRYARGLGEAAQARITERLKGLPPDMAWAWIRRCELDIDGPTLLVRAPDRLAADRISNQFDGDLRRAWGGNVAVSVIVDQRAA